MKNVLLSISLVALSLSFLLPSYAAAPAKIAQVAPIGDLVREADAKIASLEESLATDSSYLASKGTKIPTDAGVLAVLSQAIVESDEKAAWQPSAKDVRDAAIAVWNSKTHADAKQGLAAIQEAHSGKVGGAKPEYEWNKLCKLGSVMKEINTRNGKLRRLTKKDMTDDEAQSAAGDATVMAVLALAAHDDTHEVKKKEEVPEWQKYSKEFQAQMTALSAAARKKDKAAAADAFKKGNTACNDCHGKFREKE